MTTTTAATTTGGNDDVSYGIGGNGSGGDDSGKHGKNDGGECGCRAASGC